MRNLYKMIIRRPVLRSFSIGGSLSALKFLLWRRRIANIALIFMLIGVFLCQDLYALRVPVGLDKTKKRYKIHERHGTFTEEINKAREELGIEKGETVDVHELAGKTKYKTKAVFMRKANEIRFNIGKLRSLGIKGIRSPRSKVLSIEELSKSIAIKEKEGGLSSETIDAIKEAILIIMGMTQGKSVKYSRVEDIQDNIDEVIKGIFEGIVFDRVESIRNNAVNWLEMDDDEERLQGMKKIVQSMNEIASTIEAHIFKFSDDMLMGAIARHPRYLLDDRDKIEKDIWDRVNLDEDKDFLTRIRKRMKKKGNTILRKIGSLNKAVKKIEDNLKEKKRDKETTADYEDALKLRYLCDNVVDKFAPALIISIGLLLDDAGKELSERILKRLGKTQYSEKNSLLFDKARELLDKTKESAFFIREAKRKIAFHKVLYSKLSDFTFFSQEEWNMVSSYKKPEIEECIEIIRSTSRGLLQIIEELEQSQVTLGGFKRRFKDL